MVVRAAGATVSLVNCRFLSPADVDGSTDGAPMSLYSSSAAAGIPDGAAMELAGGVMLQGCSVDRTNSMPRSELIVQTTSTDGIPPVFYSESANIQACWLKVPSFGNIPTDSACINIPPQPIKAAPEGLFLAPEHVDLGAIEEVSSLTVTFTVW